MATARPPAEDIVIHRRSPARFVIGVGFGAPQVVCDTFEEALQHAHGFASDRHLHVWMTNNLEDFVEFTNEPLVRRLWGHYVDMPGMKLTRAQVGRLLGADDTTCAELLENLVRSELLVRGADGRYARHALRIGAPAHSRIRMAKADIPPRAQPARRVH